MSIVVMTEPQSHFSTCLENSGSERAHRTHTEEFHKVTESSFGLTKLKDELLEWEGVYNTLRPHQVLGYVRPLEFLDKWKECQEGGMCH